MKDWGFEMRQRRFGDVLSICSAFFAKPMTWAFVLVLGIALGTTAGHAKSSESFLGFVEVRLQIEDDFSGARMRAWDVRERWDGSNEWSIRDDLYYSGAIGWLVVRIDAPNGSFRTAAVPVFHDESATVAPFYDESSGPDGYDVPWHFQLKDGRLHIGVEDGTEGTRIILPGDTWSNVERPDIEVVSHPLFKKDDFMLFRIFIDVEPPGDER